YSCCPATVRYAQPVIQCRGHPGQVGVINGSNRSPTFLAKWFIVADDVLVMVLRMSPIHNDASNATATAILAALLLFERCFQRLSPPPLLPPPAPAASATQRPSAQAAGSRDARP